MKEIWDYCIKWILIGAVIGAALLAIFEFVIGGKVVDDTVFHESITVQEIKENLPKHGYILDRYDYKMSEEGCHEVFYEKDGDPFIFKSASTTINSSNIEDGMIYTLTREVLETGTIVERLYINEPYTLELIAMGETIKDEDRDLYLLYTFLDKKGYTWYDKHNANLCESED